MSDVVESKRAAPRKIDESTRLEIIRLYVDCETSMQSIAETLGIGLTTVFKHLRKAGIKTRSHGCGKKVQFTKEELKERARLRSLEYNRKNKEKTAAYREKNKERRASSRKAYFAQPHVKASQAARQRNILKTVTGSINNRMSCRMRDSLRRNKSGRSWSTLVGYSVDDLRVHLGRQFTKGMNWDNMGEWHIDHIIPLSSFKFETPDDPEFRAAWALTNLRPLWAINNIIKKDKRLVLL